MNLVEPFAGSLAVLLARPQPFNGPETVNDINGWLTNLWRALQADPDAVTRYADWPVSELDLHARGNWLFYRPGVANWIELMRSDPDFYDAKSAGWWLWGQCAWIGGGWGPSETLHKKLPHLGNAGQGINRQLPHLGNAGQGINRANGDTPRGRWLREYLRQLSERLRGIRICCGDWSRVCGPTPTIKQGLTAVFLDPPYGVADRDARCYGADDDLLVSAAVRKWCLHWQDHPQMRIALCGYEGEHDMPAPWECLQWKAVGGYGSQSEEGNDNCRRERIWFNKSCERERLLFDL